MTYPTKKLGKVCDVFADGDWIETKDQSLSGIRLIQTGIKRKRKINAWLKQKLPKF